MTGDLPRATRGAGGSGAACTCCRTCCGTGALMTADAIVCCCECCGSGSLQPVAAQPRETTRWSALARFQTIALRFANAG